jgi:DNA-binding LacI/PurR family transcriptional regulator
MRREAPARPHRRATSADVAREAGVSRTTVSFVLNDRPDQTIPAETRRRVLEAADRLSYAPSAEARALSRGRSDIVLLYLPPTLPLTADMGLVIEHLSAAFADAGLTMVAQPWNRRPAADVWTAVTPAAVLAWDLEDADAEHMRRSGVQVVTSMVGSDPIGRWVTGAREDEIARLQVGRLADGGHRNLGYAMPHGDRMSDATRLRLQALRKACAERGLPEPVPLPVPLDRPGGAAAITGWRTADDAVTGVCAHDGTVALAVLAGLRHHGLTAPDDLAVVGVNDSPAAALAEPALTMVAIDHDAQARFIVEAITALLDGRPAPPPPTGVASLVERHSG